MSKSDDLEKAHNDGQKDAATSDRTLLGETNYRPPGFDMYIDTGADARRESYNKGFDHVKKQK